MKKNNKKKNITTVNILMVFAFVIFSLISLKLWLKQEEYEETIDKLNIQLEKEKEDTLLFEKTKDFIISISSGNYEMLTSSAKKQLEERLNEQGIDYHGHDHSILDKIEIYNVYAFKTSENTATSYGIYRTYYDLDDSDIPSRQQILTLSIQIEWIKEGNEYKVNKYEFQLLKDSLDEYLQKSIGS